ncbi:AlwI family type II restriction endonuclease [Bacillus toyonensis]|nr:AlwI family type II restriction endonuclease [Bacillus toyonensis]
MSKYDLLDPRNELEQTITQDLENAFEKRGFEVRHNGGLSHAPAGVPDIEFFNETYHFTVEVAKRLGAQQDGEFNSIKDHLQKVKERSSEKQCYCLFVTPQTSKRMFDSIRDHNRQRIQDGRNDMKIIPINFETLDLYLDRLINSDFTLYPITSFMNIFSSHNEFVDDLRIRKLLQQNVFPLDLDLLHEIESSETERDMKTLEELIKDLDKVENTMRENGIATGTSAINTLIYLVFMKIFEEKRERKNEENRLLDKESFNRYKSNLNRVIREDNRAIHELFTVIKEEREFVDSGMFTANDFLPDSLRDDFITETIIPIFCKYNFLGTMVDALGAVYEVLAKRSEKDVRVGQFFTPDNVVRFMVKLAELEQNDYVLDPACGTGRFLIHSMNEILKAVDEPTERRQLEKEKNIKTNQLHGSDIDMRVAKIAKMNMWVHGDGKTNIRGEANGLTLYNVDGANYENSFDVVLTNPPLGEVNYQTATFTNIGDIQARMDRFPILPIKNKTEEKKQEVISRIRLYSRELADLEQQQSKFREGTREYRSIATKIQSKTRTINTNIGKLDQLEEKIASSDVELEITGSKMKGGALFLPSIWHYLKHDTEKSDLAEWRGGKLITVLDEGILNTDEYADIRNYLKTHFYIKAVISLTRDTFVPISKTSTKTSILYAIKKVDVTATQKEPIFFAHVDKVGVNTQGKETENHLPKVLAEWQDFKRNILNSYRRNEFVQELFLQHTSREG